MRRYTNLFLLLAFALSCASIGLWRVQGQRSSKSNHMAEAANSKDARSGGVTAHFNDDSFVLKNMKLSRIVSSTVMQAEVVNKSNRHLAQATFEVRAFDGDGKLLRGVERRTIFTVNQLKAHASAPINSGYGVWLQGIPLDRIARVEISETSDEMNAASALKVIPLASHVAAWKEYSEIEE